MGANKSSLTAPSVDPSDILVIAEKTGKPKSEIDALVNEIFQLNPEGRLNLIAFTYYYKKLFFSLVTPIFKPDAPSSTDGTIATLVNTTAPSPPMEPSTSSSNPQNGVVVRRSLANGGRQGSIGIARRSINFVTSQLAGGIDPTQQDLQLRMEHSWEFASIEQDQLEKAHLFAHKCFKAFDLDHRGYLGFEDLFIAFVLTTSDELVNKLNYTFRYYDKNHDSRLDRHELKLIVKVMYNLLDMSNENNEYLDYDSCVDYIMTRLDDNKDNYISLDEFVNNLVNDEILCNLLAPFNH